MGKTEIWIALRNRGYSTIATAAIMGNIQAESAFRPDNVEERCPLTDGEYTAKVDNELIPKQSFIRDAYGYGLCQWTYSTRKAGLYDLCKKRGVSISNVSAQLDFMGNELAEHEYVGVRAALNGNSLYDATAVFMRKFENPADQSDAAIKKRVEMAQAIYNELSGVSLDKPAESGEDNNVPTKLEYWPPRGYTGGTKDPGLCFGMEGPDVMVMQAVLYARDYNTGTANGIFNAGTKTMLMAFQAEHDLTPDGICGPKTWKSLLEV